MNIDEVTVVSFVSLNLYLSDHRASGGHCQCFERTDIRKAIQSVLSQLAIRL